MWIVFFALFLADGASAQTSYEICPRIHSLDHKVTLNRNERILVCGSDEGGEGWRDVPIPQAQLQLAGILQAQGYLQPRFEQDGESLKLWTGPRTLIKSIGVTGGEPPLRPQKKRKMVGEVLTPTKLDELKSWAETGLRSNGYACPKVTVEAQAWDAHVEANVDPGLRQRIGALEIEGLEGVDPESLDRFRPFERGDLYDVRKTQIMTNRMMAQGLFQSAYVTTACEGDRVDLKLNTSVGRPRLVRFGVGASTEEFPFVDFSFRNARLDPLLSSLYGLLHLSPLEQRLSANADLYWIPGSKQSYFGPRFSIGRKKERAYESYLAKLGADLGRDWDHRDIRVNGRVGPTLNQTKTLDGFGPADQTYLSWEGSVGVTSHVYEVTSLEQSGGWTTNFRYRGQRKGLGSPLNANRFEVEAKTLWNIGEYSPPLLVLGTRLEAIGVEAQLGDNLSQATARDALPIEYRVYYGGDRNLRGFAREVINNNGRGYLSALSAGFELRLVEELPWRLQPFLLFDVARLGGESFKVDEALFTSEGVGLRWSSPVGVLRGSYARGRVLGTDTSSDPVLAAIPQEWVFFVSFGQEF